MDFFREKIYLFMKGQEKLNEKAFIDNNNNDNNNNDNNNNNSSYYYNYLVLHITFQQKAGTMTSDVRKR